MKPGQEAVENRHPDHENQGPKPVKTKISAQTHPCGIAVSA